MNELYAIVERGTRPSVSYLEHAAPESMAHYLRDWKDAHDLLGVRIRKMTEHEEARRAARDRGEWPPPVEQVESPAVDKVVNLMAALEASVANAKATRDRATSDSTEQGANPVPRQRDIGPEETAL